MMTTFLFNAALLGMGATAFMDVIALVQKRILSQPSLDWGMVGRWIGHLACGEFCNHPISTRQPIPFERAIGWCAHYLIGVVFALAFLALVGQGWLRGPSVLPALAFGALTVLAPFLVLQPGMGAGLFARNMPKPNNARLKSFVAHLSYGMGLWVAAICVSEFS